MDGVPDPGVGFGTSPSNGQREGLSVLAHSRGFRFFGPAPEKRCALTQRQARAQPCSEGRIDYGIGRNRATAPTSTPNNSKRAAIPQCPWSPHSTAQGGIARSKGDSESKP
jgi:hypothetical protein